MSSVETILAEAKDLTTVARYELAMALLEELREPIGAPKGKRSKASGEPKVKRGQTSWNIGCEVVREAVKGVSGYKPPHVMAFAKVLKAADEAGWASMAAEVIAEQYAEWLKENSDVGSRSSGGSKAPKAPKAEPTEEEKAAKRKLGAEKRKATMAANKAAAAAEAPKPAAEPAKPAKAAAPKAAPKPAAEPPKAAAAEESEDLEEEPEVEMTAWEHDFGSGPKMYARYEKGSDVFIYETDGTTYLGQLIKGKLNPKKADPLA